jgi:tripartite-type tricarboxylate transporter receptor subunit TctC
MRRLLLAVAATLALAATPATAQDKWPSKPVTVIVPFAAGGNTDVLARLFGEKVGQALGQQFVIENKAGAGGSVGLAQLAKSAPDGYTIGVGTTGGLAINPAMSKGRLSYDPAKDFTYLYGMANQPNMFVVHPSVPANTLPELITWLKANPETAYGTSGVGSTQHVCGEAFAQQAGVKIAAVAYRASNQTMQDLIAGQIKLACDNYSSAIEQVRAGKIRAIAITSPQRYPLAPEIPAVAETLPGYEINVVFGWLAPAGLPADIAKRLTDALMAAGNDPTIQQRLKEFGVLQTAWNADAYAKAAAAERALLGPIVEKAGMTAN